MNEGMSTFSPDGKRIVFRSSRNGNMNLYLMDADGRNVRQLTNGPWRDNFPVFSPDGKAIAFSSDRDGPKDIRGNRTFDNYILQLNPDGTPGSLQRLTTDPARTRIPTFRRTEIGSAFPANARGSTTKSPSCRKSSSRRRCTEKSSSSGSATEKRCASPTTNGKREHRSGCLPQEK